MTIAAFVVNRAMLTRILANALKNVTSARTVATWIGSEVDDADLTSSSSAEYQGRPWHRSEGW